MLKNFNYPFVIENKNSIGLPDFLTQNEEIVQNILSKNGAILFRGFDVNTVDEFKAVNDNISDKSPLLYNNRSSPRFEIQDNIYMSTTYPPNQQILMHSENSYARSWAKKIMFCCITKPDIGGETPISDNRRVLKNISPILVEKFQKKRGVKYFRNLSKWYGLSWEEVFQTESKLEVEKICKLSNTDFEWRDDGEMLVISWIKDTVVIHPDSNEKIWFNHAMFFNKYSLSHIMDVDNFKDSELPFNTFFGDGDEITLEEYNELKNAYEEAMVLSPWEVGDVILLDNMLISHGRMPFKGDRKIIVSMFDGCSEDLINKI